jgi:hypothetical protein
MTKKKSTAPFEKFLEVEKIKGKINALYDSLNEITSELHKDYGDESFFWEIEEDENGCKFAKLEIVDNIKKLELNGYVHSNNYIKPVSLEVKRTKTAPKSGKPGS